MIDDESYRVTKQMILDGQLGDIHAVEASCLDPQDKNGNHPAKTTVTPRKPRSDDITAFYVTFSQQSGGIFVDAGIHLVRI